jgi:hypothetical protein
MSLDILESTTKDLGQRLRNFESATCSAFETHELKHEAEARQRWQTKVATEHNTASTPGITDDLPPSPNPPSAPNPLFNLPSTFMGPPHLFPSSIDEAIQSQANPRPDLSPSYITSMASTTDSSHSAPITIAAKASPHKFKSNVKGKTPLQRHIACK